MIKEERKLIDTLRTYLSDTHTELEIAYISDFENFYKSFVTAELTSAQWEYVKVGLEKFKELYAKYSVQNDVAKLQKYETLLTDFYNVNTERNYTFLKNMNILSSDHPTLRPSELPNVLNSSKKILVLISGGYHTEGITEILNKNNISNITITPEVTKVSSSTRNTYENLVAKQAMSVRQMIALGLITNKNISSAEQVSAVMNTMFRNNPPNNINVNMLATYCNQIFNQDVSFSVLPDGKTIEVSFPDGTNQTIDVAGEVVNVAKELTTPSLGEEESLKFSPGKFVQLTGEKLKRYVNFINKTSFEFGKDIFAPQIYQISKDVCAFLVENKWYLGNGAIFDIAMSNYEGKSLDGIEPIIYEYMPGFMQEGLLAAQEQKDKPAPKTPFGEILKRVSKTVITIVMALVIAISTVACGSVKNEPIEKPAIILSTEQQNFNREVSLYLDEFYDSDGKYNSFIYDNMNTDNTYINTYLISLQNLYDQSLAALSYMQIGEIEKAEQIFDAIKNDDTYYKSNKEGVRQLGEIVWVGIAVSQYKILQEKQGLDSSKYDEILDFVDDYMRRCRNVDGGYTGQTNVSWISTEHMWDVIAYLNLKTQFDDSEIVKNQLLASAKYIYNNLYDEENGVFIRGHNDYGYVMDASVAWAGQVIIALKDYNFDIYEESGLNNVDMDRLLDFAEKEFKLTGKQYENLYKWSNDASSPWSSEWSLQYAILLNLLGYQDRADAILQDTLNYSRDLGAEYGYIVYSDKNGVKNYLPYGWNVYVVNSLCSTVGQRTQLEYGVSYLWYIKEIEGIDYSHDAATTFEYSAILPSTFAKINNLIIEGSATTLNILKTILKAETWFSFTQPIGFYRAHNLENRVAAGRLAQITNIAKLASSLVTISVVFILLSINLSLLPSLAILIGTFVGTRLLALFTNVTIHAIMDFRFIKASGLEEAIKEYGKERVSFNEDGTIFISEKNPKVIPSMATPFPSVYSDVEYNRTTYIITDVPENAKDFNFRNVGSVLNKNGEKADLFLGEYREILVLYAKDAAPETLVDEFQKNPYLIRHFGLRFKNDFIQIDMVNPDREVSYSQSGHIIVGANVVKTGEYIDYKKEAALVANKKVDAVTINQNIAVFINDDAYVVDGNIVSTVNAFVRAETLGTEAKILFTSSCIDNFINSLEGDVYEKKIEFRKIIKKLKDENKEICVVFEDDSKNTDLNKYFDYGIFNYVANGTYFDAVSVTKTRIKIVSKLSDIGSFDGSISVLKISDFKDEIDETSGIFTFLNSAINIRRIMADRKIDFVRQAATNFDFNQIPEISQDIISDIINSDDEEKFELLSTYLEPSSQISIYYNTLKDSEKVVFTEEILKRILAVNYLRQQNVKHGLRDHKLEVLLAQALYKSVVPSYNKKSASGVRYDRSTWDIIVEVSAFKQEVLGMTPAGVYKSLNELLSRLAPLALEQSDPDAIFAILDLIPIYADKNIAPIDPSNIEFINSDTLAGLRSVLASA